MGERHSTQQERPLDATFAKKSGLVSDRERPGCTSAKKFFEWSWKDTLSHTDGTYETFI